MDSTTRKAVVTAIRDFELKGASRTPHDYVMLAMRLRESQLKSLELSQLAEEALDIPTRYWPPTTGPLPMGCGEHSAMAIHWARKRLDEAFAWLSGSQQPPDIHQPHDEARYQSEQAEARNAIAAVLAELRMALLGPS